MDFRPLNLESLQTVLYRLRAYLAALVHRGHDPRTITCLRDVAAVDTVKDGLRWFIQRDPNGATGRASDIAATVTAMARHWAGVDGPDLPKHCAPCAGACGPGAAA